MKLKIMQIIKLLLSSTEIMTINQIAEAIGVSNKTIRNYFQSVEQILKDHHLELVKKSGVGVYIVGEENDKLAMLTDIKNYRDDNRQFSSSDRQLYMLNQLLTGPKMATISGFEDELYISRPSVYKDLEKVRQWLEKRDIKLIHEPRKGLYIKAGEKRIRKSLFDLFIMSNEHDEIIDLVESRDGSYNYYSYDQKEDILYVDFDTVQDIIKSFEKALNIIFTANGLARLTIKYCIAINRMIDGHFVTMRPHTIDQLKKLERYATMLEMANIISERFNITFTEEEICYLFGITLGTKTHYDQKNLQLNEEVMAINKIIAQEIVENTKRNFEIVEEESFFNGLLHHLKTVAHKINYGFDFHNEFLEEIQTNYPEAYAIALKSRRVFDYFFSISIPIDEVGFIALHIASAIERSKRPLSLCVIYSNSYSEIKLMLEFLNNRYRQIDIKKVIPVSLYQESLFDEFDLVISTEPIANANEKKLVILPSILIHKDMNKFTSLLNKIYEEHNRELLTRREE